MRCNQCQLKSCDTGHRYVLLGLDTRLVSYYSETFHCSTTERSLPYLIMTGVYHIIYLGTR